MNKNNQMRLKRRNFGLVRAMIIRRNTSNILLFLNYIIFKCLTP